MSLGALRPESWTQFAVGTALAVAAATVLNIAIPRLYPWREAPGRDRSEERKSAVAR